MYILKLQALVNALQNLRIGGGPFLRGALRGVWSLVLLRRYFIGNSDLIKNKRLWHQNGLELSLSLASRIP